MTMEVVDTHLIFERAVKQGVVDSIKLPQAVNDTIVLFARVAVVEVIFEIVKAAPVAVDNSFVLIVETVELDDTVVLYPTKQIIR